jgi:hypothetical protein
MGLQPCDVLVPTCDRPGALAVTLAGLAPCPPERVVVADQSVRPVSESGEVQAMLGVREHAGTRVEVHRRPARRGVAEQRAFVLARALAASGCSAWTTTCGCSRGRSL